MPSFLSRLQSLVSGEAPPPQRDDGDDAAHRGVGTAADAPVVEPEPALVPPALTELLSGAAGREAPVPLATDAWDGSVACWAVRPAPGSSALQLRDLLRSRLVEPAPARWWPLVSLGDRLGDALTEEPETPEEVAGLDVEEGPALLDERWEVGADRAEREGRLGMHRGTTPAPTVAAVTRALVEPPEESEDDVVAVVLAHASWQLPAVLGWAPADCGVRAHDLSAVLRYWEDQWGAELVALGASSLVLRVSDPPESAEDAAALAQELLAVAPASVSEDLVEPLPRAAELLAPALLGAGWWHLDLG